MTGHSRVGGWTSMERFLKIKSPLFIFSFESVVYKWVGHVADRSVDRFDQVHPVGLDCLGILWLFIPLIGHHLGEWPTGETQKFGQRIFLELKRRGNLLFWFLNEAPDDLREMQPSGRVTHHSSPFSLRFIPFSPVRLSFRKNSFENE